jgi:hypothetical protein
VGTVSARDFPGFFLKEVCVFKRVIFCLVGMGCMVLFQLVRIKSQPSVEVSSAESISGQDPLVAFKPAFDAMAKSVRAADGKVWMRSVDPPVQSPCIKPLTARTPVDKVTLPEIKITEELRRFAEISDAELATKVCYHKGVLICRNACDHTLCELERQSCIQEQEQKQK